MKKEVATETETRESVVLVPDPIVSAPWLVLFGRVEPFVIAVKTRRTSWCCVFYWKGDLGDEGDGKKGDTIMLLCGDDDGRPPRSARRAEPRNSGPDRC